MNETSLSLLDRARGDTGDEAWQRMSEVYSALLQSWLVRFEVAAADTDDVVQEVLLTVSRELQKFEHSGRTGAFRSWLRTILVHRLRDFWRSRKYRPAVTGGSSWQEQLEQLADESSNASREWNLEHDRHVMARLLEQVRPRFEAKTWEAFRRQMFDGQRADVVAADLGMPLNSVYVARSRVLSTLRREAAGL
ncbi:MAG: sigma-70 family RNA polymerase sigma factor, partial [Candidatus Saccharimonas sp.]|nr:sigma-70 family RNA polymerase sigma factor [Planctomycetaceae bacterium]